MSDPGKEDMKLTACMLCRDDESTLETAISSIRPHVDELVIVDTGSTDESPDIAKEHADKFEVYTDCNDANGLIESFARARDYCYSLATGDWTIWIDADDKLFHGDRLREIAKSLDQNDHAYVLFPYEYNYDAHGVCNYLQYRERLVKGWRDFHWESPVHEVFRPNDLNLAFHTEITNAVLYKHRAHMSTSSRRKKDPWRNLRILKRHIEKHGESDVRALHCMGTELAKYALSSGEIHQLGASNRFLKRHLELCGWDSERHLSMLWLARNYAAVGMYAEAIKYAHDATDEKSLPDGYFMLGEYYYLLAEQGSQPEKNWARAANKIQHGLFNYAQSILMCDPTTLGRAYEFLQGALHKLGDIDGCRKACEKGLEVFPTSEFFSANLAAFQDQSDMKQLNATFDRLKSRGIVNTVQEKLIQSVLRGEYVTGKEIHERRSTDDNAGTADAPAASVATGGHRHLSIAIYVGDGPEPWTPEQIYSEGRGGSETMAWEMAKRLAARGHDVWLFGGTPGAITVDGVHHYMASAAVDRYSPEFDLLIASRIPEAVTLCKARHAVGWVHDVHFGGDRFTADLCARYDEIWCLSKWHGEYLRKLYPFLTPGKIWLTRNGIDPKLYLDRGNERNPRHAFYSSSPDRGLEMALRSWPIVRKSAPDAVLHVAYGFNNWCKSAPHHAQLINRIRTLIAETDGVVMHGRLGKRALAELQMSCGVWYYPTFPWADGIEAGETSCITAMEAQAAGCWSVTAAIAALKETVFAGSIMKHNVPKTWASEVIEAMGDDGEKPITRTEMANEGKRRFSLETLADDWDQHIRKLCE
jgi:glycosyltransferase involved in cell wall biosynthesis